MRTLVSSVLLATVFATTFVALLFGWLDLWVIREEAGASRWNPRVLFPTLGLIVSLLGLLVLHIEAVIAALRSRKAYVALLFGANVLVAGGITVLVNVVGARHGTTFDWTWRGLFEVSERTRAVLRDLPRTVTANVIASSSDPLFATVKGTLDIYRSEAKGRLDLTYFDPANDREKLLAKLRSLGVDPKEISEPNLVIFECASSGAGQPLSKHVAFSSTVELEGGERLKSIKAEAQFTEAILSVTKERKAKVLLLVGHEELEPLRGSQEGQIAVLERTLRQLNFEVSTFELDFAETSRKKEIPSDCDALVIAGPRARFQDREVDALKAYLARGGRALILAEPILKQRPGSRSVYFDDTRIDMVLKDYGLALDACYAFDPGSKKEFALAAEVDAGASHPIVKPLAGQPLILFSAQAVTVLPLDPLSKVKTTTLLESTAATVGVRDMSALDRSGNPFAVDHRKGPLTLAAAAVREVDPPTGTALPEGKRPEARLVLVGDATFATDDLSQSVLTNLDFAVNCVSWLAEREETIAIGGKKPEQIHLTMDADQRTRVTVLVMLILPVSCAMLGLAVVLGRRS